MNTIWDRVWPIELLALQSNPRAIPCGPGEFLHVCENCGGQQIMLVYVLGQGPMQSPNGGKVSFFHLAPDPDHPDRPSRSGWYAYDLHVAACPVCQEGRTAQWLEHNCGLTGSDLYLTVADFRALDGKVEGLNVARSLLAMNTQPVGFVTFWGDYGTGKSHLLKGLVNGFRQVGVRARYAVLSDLLDDIRYRFGDDNGGVAVSEAIDQYRKVPVLCVDEVGDNDRVNLTGWVKETVFRLLNDRYDDRDTVLTVMGSNVAPDRMTAEWGFLRSRMSGGQIVQLAGVDMRPYGLKPAAPAPKPPVPEPEYATYDTMGAVRDLSNEYDLPF